MTLAFAVDSDVSRLMMSKNLTNGLVIEPIALLAFSSTIVGPLARTASEFGLIRSAEITRVIIQVFTIYS